MTDIFTPEKRSWIMSRIKGRGTRIEVIMMEVMTKHHIEFEYQPKMYGNPDFLVGWRIAVFCDGDFWHGFKYEDRRPRTEYWKDKIESNMRRDRKIARKMRRDGYSVIRLWEHSIVKDPETCVRRILRHMRGPVP